VEGRGTVLEANQPPFRSRFLSKRNGRNTACPSPEGEFAVLQWSEKIGTVEKRFLSRKTVRDPGTADSKRSSPFRRG